MFQLVIFRSNPSRRTVEYFIDGNPEKRFDVWDSFIKQLMDISVKIPIGQIREALCTFNCFYLLDFNNKIFRKLSANSFNDLLPLSEVILSTKEELNPDNKYKGSGLDKLAFANLEIEENSVKISL